MMTGGQKEVRLGPKEAALAGGGPPLGKDRISGQHLAEYLKTSLEKAQNIRHCSENFHRAWCPGWSHRQALS